MKYPDLLLTDPKTERDMLDLLRHRYADAPPRRGRPLRPQRYIIAEHVPCAGYGARRIADFMARDTWSGGAKGPEHPIHGVEVKVSRADWLTELRAPEKAEQFRPFMNYWWLAVPNDNIVKPGELPAGWGLLVARGGKLVASKGAPLNVPEPMPAGMNVGFLRQALKTTQPGGTL